MFVAVLRHNKWIRGNLQWLSMGWGKLNRRACHHRRRTFCLLESRHDECTRKTSSYDPCSPVSSSFTVMFRFFRSNNNIGSFVCMFLVLRLCFHWRNTGLSRGGGGGTGLGGQPNYGVIPWLPEAPALPTCYFLWVFCSLVLVVSGNRSGAAGSVTLSTSSAICWFIVNCLMAVMFKLAVLHCC